LFSKKGDSIELFWNSREQKQFAPTGSFSDSSKASPEKGRLYHEYMVHNLVEFINWLRKHDGPIG
jgi:creatinine amidohydrolase